MSTRIGIVGLPNAGKSSLFNALTKAGAQTGNYPFTTIDPNVAVVPVEDERLRQVAETVGASEVVFDTIDFHDIAGLIAGAHKGEGLGNRFLAHIRETDAILHVLRVHTDPNVVHPEGEVDPVRDLEVVETELVLADLEVVQRRIGRVEKGARGSDPAAQAELTWLQEVGAALEAGKPARAVEPPPEAKAAARSLGLITAKPMLLVANVGEEEGGIPPSLVEAAASRGAPLVAISARAESELAELEPEEAADLRQELGLGEEAALQRLVREAFALLGLIAFFTAGEGKPAQSWHVPAGSTVHSAAGKIHTDIQKGFVRAEVVPWHDLVEAGGWAQAREKGQIRLEGRDYLVHDGDVITVRFTPPSG
jgi:GTP-binding protein YchF